MKKYFITWFDEILDEFCQTNVNGTCVLVDVLERLHKSDNVRSVKVWENSQASKMIIGSQFLYSEVAESYEK